MKMLLIMTLICISLTTYSQRYIREKTTLSYLTDSAFNTITGTQNQMRNYIDNNVADSDTSNFEVVSNLPVTYVKLFYQGVDNNIELVDLTPMTTNRIDKIKRPKQGMLRYDRTLDKLRLYIGTAWKYIQLEP